MRDDNKNEPVKTTTRYPEERITDKTDQQEMSIQ